MRFTVGGGNVTIEHTHANIHGSAKSMNILLAWHCSFGFLLYGLVIAKAGAKGAIYGLALTSNSPAEVSLAQLDTGTGNVTTIGPKQNVLDGMGELSTVDPDNRILYYLGDTSSGATLVGLDLENGNLLCKGAVPLREVGYVGIAQSIDFDSKNKDLVITGLTEGNQTGHSVLRSPGCKKGSRKIGPVVHVGIFGDASYLPMLHGSCIDAEQQRLFVTVALSKQEVGVGVIDLNSKKPMLVLPADKIEHFLLGMHYNVRSQTVMSVVQTQNGELELNTLKVEGTKPTWKSLTLPTQKYQWLYGNTGSVSAFNVDEEEIYVLACEKPSGGGELPPMHLICISVPKGEVTNTPLVSDLPLGANTLNEMNYVVEA